MKMCYNENNISDEELDLVKTRSSFILNKNTERNLENMAIILNPKVIPCQIDYSGPLPELGCICGPVNYCRLTIDQIRLLIKNGRTIYELNPNDINDKVRLTTMNMEIRQFEKHENSSDISPELSMVPEPEDDMKNSFVEEQQPQEYSDVVEPSISYPEEEPVEDLAEAVEETENAEKEPTFEEESSDSIVEQINPDSKVENYSNYNGKKNRKSGNKKK